ncbi:unnamed protein product [Owenia fusiformis]|uniref:SKI/SNO/DAC domain-containing protein n=1 Tax=Owenia fusiformis TaxID=6347 RepID=A0A8J1XL24_OWEFU|nr:unnamed protein product [Owenia fusiformis]
MDGPTSISSSQHHSPRPSPPLHQVAPQTQQISPPMGLGALHHSPIPAHGMPHTAAIYPITHKLDKPAYSTPPPVTSNPENNTCKMIEYRGAKIAAFTVDGRELICLPQAFDLFLKHLVGGLHTVYTKLKRLDITPIVCNVEQVRILRGLGAIQPGVNRCKLISPKEFDILYDDCTNSSARPGRPPKRSPSVHANPETLEKLKKSRLDLGDYHYPPMIDPKKAPLLANGFSHYLPHLGAVPFMPLNHPMMSTAVSMAMANHLRGEAQPVMRERSESDSDLMSPRSIQERMEHADHHRDGHHNHHPHDDKLSPHYPHLIQHRSYDRRVSTTDKESGIGTPSDAPSGMDLSTKSALHSGNSDDADEDTDDEEAMNTAVKQPIRHSSGTDLSEKPSPPAIPNFSAILNAENSGISSIETLLLNIQGLLKVAAENARHHERQINYEKAELKMELMRERELRENFEKQLQEEQRNRVVIQKRYRKEKKTRRRLQEEIESVEQKRPLSAEDLRKSPQSDNSRVQDVGPRMGVISMVDSYMAQQKLNNYLHPPSHKTEGISN